ncbi:uncharacterized protein LOC118187608 [Stegodyphus dumicola]|uniref:uncharacterized protein LOC118187608 n=1 Tax=Stegodyphus dumicola TaxID=202533 RepID=UPI0015A98FB5|nr:uncharacterized protein LOC118187608 [Stegodyphus dumicola]
MGAGMSAISLPPHHAIPQNVSWLSEAATSQAVTHATSHDEDLLLIQEPYCREGQVASLAISWKVYQHKAETNEQSPRAAKACTSPSWSLLVIKQERDFVAILLAFNNAQYIIASIYSSPTDSITDTTSNILDTIQRCPPNSLLLSGDFNAHNTIWGFADTMTKGQELDDFLAAKNIDLLNTPDSPPTFDNTYHVGWPDLTLCSSSIAVLYWTVVDDESCSDHKYLHFLINCDTKITVLRRYKLPGNKIRPLSRSFTRILNNEENNLALHNSPEGMEIFTDRLLENLKAACSELLPIHAQRRKYKELSGGRKSSDNNGKNAELSDAAYVPPPMNEDRKSELLATFRKERALYKNNILAAKITSWRKFCTENSNPYGILHKLASSKIYQPAQIFMQPPNTINDNPVQNTATTILNEHHHNPHRQRGRRCAGTENCSHEYQHPTDST